MCAVPAPDVNYRQLPEVVRLRREELGLTQVEAAVKADVSPSTWRAIEKAGGDGDNRRRGLTMAAVAKALDWSMEELAARTRGEDVQPQVPVRPQIAALSGKLDRLTENDRRYVEELVDRFLGEEP